ncbi:unnamed protein product [Orchesella dallaii]|uniref:Large ribosomal subunit protein mL53 n=1 Tax=Orchesella dallaii TaxID=48710 RepID=A0ABP1PSW9_9HEXA
MSVFRKSGLVRKPTGIFNVIISEVKRVSLQPVQRVTYTFDPFHENAKTVRDLMFILSFPKIRETNYKCAFKTNVVCDRSEGSVECKLENGKSVLFKTGNLTTLEILQQLNKVVLPLVPPPQDLSASIPKTKSQKKK